MSQRTEVFARVALWFEKKERQETLKALREYSPAYYRLYSTIRQSLEGKTDKELECLARADEHVSQTNCGWTSYAVAPLVAQEARAILYARSLAPTETSEEGLSNTETKRSET